MQRDTSYAAPVQNITQCFDRANALDPQRPGCPLDPGFQLDVRSGANEVRPEVDGKLATWDAALRGNQPYYAYKRLRAGEDTCGSLAGYSPAILVAEAPVISDPIGAEDGYYFLCVISGNTPSFDSSWQQPSHASIRFKRIDSQPPLVPLDYEIDVLQDAYRLLFLGPEGSSDLGFALEKRGSLTATDCSNPQGYRVQISIPDVVKTNDFPTRICVKTSNKAGNFADPAAFDFGPPALLPKAVRNAASLQRGGVVAPGSVFRVDTFNLTNVAEFSTTPLPMLAGVQISVLDRAGQTLPVLMTTAGPLFTEGVMPDAATHGMATVIVQPPQGPSISQPVTIGRAAPGLYSDHGIAVPSGFALDSKGNVFPLATCLNESCFTTHLPVSSTPGGFDFVLYGTGFRARRGFVRLRIGTHMLNDVEIYQHPNIVGVDELHFHIPQDFPLRLFQPILAETSDGDSNYLWIYLQ